MHDVEVTGVEVTQAIQYFRSAVHLTDPKDQERDNSMPFIAGKIAWVRVYLIGHRRDPIPVSGKLYVEQSKNGVVTSSIVLYPFNLNDIVLVQPDHAPLHYEDERGNIYATLNFFIPTGFMAWTYSLKLRLEVQDKEDNTDYLTELIDIDIDLQQTLKLAVVYYGYKGPSEPYNPDSSIMILNAPTRDDLINTSGKTLTMFPVKLNSWIDRDFRDIKTDTWTQPMVYGTTQWSLIIGELSKIRESEKNQIGWTPNWVYHALLPRDIYCSVVLGIGGGGLSVSRSNDADTMAEEIGHAVGLPHAPCGDPDGPDPNFPAYEPYDPSGKSNALIGEYGFDTQVHQPDYLPSKIRPPTTKDFMSYCGPKWISLYNYKNLINNFYLSAESRMDEGKMKVQSYISLMGFLDAQDKLEVSGVFRLETRSFINGGQITDLYVELLDADSKVISEAPIYKILVQTLRKPYTHEESNEEPVRYMIQAYLPNAGAGSTLRIRKGRKVLWQKESPETPISIHNVQPKIERDIEGRLNQINIKWDVKRSRGIEPEAWIRWSNNHGKDWNSLAVGLRGDSATLDISNIPGGDVIFEVMVHDGFFTSSAVSDPISIPYKPPLANILFPNEGISFISMGVMRLWGTAIDASGQKLPDKDMQWLLDNRPIATGSDTLIPVPAIGEHQVTLRAINEHDTSEMTRSFKVVEA